MNSSDIKLDILRKIDTLNGTSLKEAYGLLLNYLITKRSTDNWENLSLPERDMIDEGIRQLDNDEGIPHKKVVSKYRRKYSA